MRIPSEIKNIRRRKDMEEKLLDMLERICEDDIVREEYDLDLIDEGLLDSLAFAELLVDIEEEFGIVISPSEVGA